MTAPPREPTGAKMVKCTHSNSRCVCMDHNDELHHCPDCGKYGDGHGRWWKAKRDTNSPKVKP